jgi:hypothetical protein
MCKSVSVDGTFWRFYQFVAFETNQNNDLNINTRERSKFASPGEEMTVWW